MKKRTLYFLYDRLQITSSERKMMYSLTAFVLLLFAAKPFMAETEAFDESFYAPLYEEFQMLAAFSEIENDRMLTQYFPENTTSDSEELNKDPAQKALPEKKINTETVTQSVDVYETSKDSVSAEEQININKATAEELTQLPGVGPAIAARIIEYRDTNGPFESIEEIKNVRGIGEARFEAIKELITV